MMQPVKDYINVIVHCAAGLSRSGAVCEVGVVMGFEDIVKWRQPNRMVKNKMLAFIK